MAKKPPISLEELDEKQKPKGVQGPLTYQEGKKGRRSLLRFKSPLLSVLLLAVGISFVSTFVYAAPKRDVVSLFASYGDRLGPLEQQVSADTKRIDTIVNSMGQYVKKESLSTLQRDALVGYAEKRELDRYTLSSNLAALVEPFATRGDLQDYVSIKDASQYVKQTDLMQYAKGDLTQYAKQSDLSQYVKKTEIPTPGPMVQTQPVVTFEKGLGSLTVSAKSPTEGSYALRVTLVYRPSTLLGSTYESSLGTFYSLLANFGNRIYSPSLGYSPGKGWVLEEVSFYSKSFTLEPSVVRSLGLPISGLGGFGLYEVQIDIVPGVFGVGTESGGGI